MSEPFIAEITMFAGNFAPRGWAFCNGQLLPIFQHTALFSLVGITYGGDGQTTFGLPNLQGRAPMHPGHGSGLTPRSFGQSGGVETVTLTEAQMPQHTHTMQASQQMGLDDDPGPTEYPARARGAGVYGPATSVIPMASESLPNAGGSQPHNNMQPYLAINFIIALVGVYPSRS